MPRLMAGKTVTMANLQAVVSIVSADRARAEARDRLCDDVEPGTEKARPKLLGLKADAGEVRWCLYLNRHLLFDDSFHITEKFERAMLHIELVRVLIVLHECVLARLHLFIILAFLPLVYL